jgi:DNA polymerase-3 subunit delta'
MSMSAAYIIVNKSQSKPGIEAILKLAVGHEYNLHNKPEGNPDLISIDLEEEKRSIGIAAVKQGIKFLAEKPFQEKNRILFIFNADKLTIEAQNSLLKTLEEPPEQALIFLVSRSAGALLDTINSRCRKLIFLDDKDVLVPSNATNLLNLSVGERLTFAEELAKEDKQTIINYLNSMALELIHSDNMKDPQELAKRLEKVSKRISDLDNTNVTARLALEELFISM